MGNPENTIRNKERKRGVTRRDFLRGLGVVGGLLLAPELLMACQQKIEELQPDTDAEKRMYGVLKRFDSIKKKTGLGNKDAATVTGAALKMENDDAAVADFKVFRNNTGVSASEAVALLGVEQMLDRDPQKAVDILQGAKKVNKDQAVNITSIAAFTKKTVPEVNDVLTTTTSKVGKELAPVVTTSGLTEGNLSTATTTLNTIKKKGVTDVSDQAAVLYASLYTKGNLDKLVTIDNELKKMEAGDDENKGSKFGPNVRANLLMAATFNGYDLEEVVEMYNFAGQLDGVDQETAAELTRMATAQNMKLAEFDQKEQKAHDADRPQTNGGFYPVYYPWGGFYYGLYNDYSYPRSSTGFSSLRSPSFSRPGVAPVRGTGGKYGGGEPIGGRGGTVGGTTGGTG